MTTIPVIDIAPFVDGTDRGAVVAAVRAACEDTGFFVIVGHGVDLELIAALRRDAARFFALPAAVKGELCRDGSVVGYSPLRSENLASTLGAAAPPDLKEAWTMARPAADRTDDEYFTGEEGAWFFPDNVFPAEPLGLADRAIASYRAMGALAETVMAIFAVALDLPEDHFTPLLQRHFSYLRILNYPAPVAAPEPGQLRAGAHTDYGSLTFVHVDDAPGGLQVRTGDGGWLDVPRVPDAFVVNLGDLMADWTDGRWRSTLHRVVVPAEEDWDRSDRLSVVFFGEPDWDAPISPIAQRAGGADRRTDRPPILAGEHLKRKVLVQQTVDG